MAEIRFIISSSSLLNAADKVLSNQYSLADICRHRNSGGTGFLFHCDVLFIAKLYFFALGALVPILYFHLLRPLFRCLFFSLSLYCHCCRFPCRFFQPPAANHDEASNVIAETLTGKEAS